MIVLPLFYSVDPSDLLQLSTQQRNYTQALERHEEEERFAFEIEKVKRRRRPANAYATNNSFNSLFLFK